MAKNVSRRCYLIAAVSSLQLNKTMQSPPAAASVSVSASASGLKRKPDDADEEDEEEKTELKVQKRPKLSSDSVVVSLVGKHSMLSHSRCSAFDA